jgi:transketolase
VLNQLVDRIHSLTGGSADLSPSTKTTLAGYGDFGWHEYCGHNLHFGVREHAMGAIVGGMALHGGLIPYAATFLTFSDYMRPPMRLAALMGIRVIYIFTHDSIGVGEDGPTHQPIEHIANLRAVPNLTVIRPSDATETVEAWRAALMNTSGPTAMLLTRQNLPVLDRETYAAAENLQYGAYILWQSKEGDPDLILIGTGSELHAALDAGKQMAQEGVNVRVVSMPSWELFEAQSEEYRDQVLPGNVRSRLAVEAGTSFGWERYVGLDGEVIAIDHFGASAPAPILFEKFGLMPEQITVRAREMLLERSKV